MDTSLSPEAPQSTSAQSTSAQSTSSQNIPSSSSSANGPAPADPASGGWHPTGPGGVQVDDVGDLVVIDHLSVADPVLVGLLRRCPEDDRTQLLERILSVGARGLATMGIGVDLSEVDTRVHRTVERVTDEAAVRAQAMLAEAERLMAASLDPEQRTSLVARAVADFTVWRDGFLTRVDPDLDDSHTGRLLSRLHDLLGPGGVFEQRLASALDPTADGSGLGKVADLIEKRFGELRDVLAEERGRRQEAERGTVKGFDYEDLIEARLRELARPLGAVVERTSTLSGSLAGEAIVGDFVVEFADGSRVAIEAKNTRSLSLTGRDGILGQLDRAIDNRDAHVGLCVSANDAYPGEVGLFGVYGNRVLVVDDGDGTMLAVGLRWAHLAASASRSAGAQVDVAALSDRLERVRMLGQRFSANRRALTEIAGSVEKVRDGLDDLRRELLDLVDDAAAGLRARSDAPVVELSLQAG